MDLFSLNLIMIIGFVIGSGLIIVEAFIPGFGVAGEHALDARQAHIDPMAIPGVLGVFIDPQGEIHSSLLVAFGETATFAGALFGIDYVYKKRS